MKKNKSTYFFLIFVITSFILAFILGGYFIGKEKANNQNVISEIKSK